ncbi:hypothetical protein BPOR_0416g00120 [Botrytis porri]|uniref:Uncharacterized protein n=1 Tax=Botrytis porri TaxID=87229 RepID=A0A4Z1KLU1_9HELO|nr:hypothetical protein BPOR_0416g00120 [Botrytis porri]
MTSRPSVANPSAEESCTKTDSMAYMHLNSAPSQSPEIDLSFLQILSSEDALHRIIASHIKTSCNPIHIRQTSYIRADMHCYQSSISDDARSPQAIKVKCGYVRNFPACHLRLETSLLFWCTRNAADTIG